MCGVCLALDATETGDRPCSPRWWHRQSWRGQRGGTHPPGSREPLDSGRVRTKRAQHSGPSPREGPQNLPRRGAPRPGPAITVHRVEAGGREGVQAEGVERPRGREWGAFRRQGAGKGGRKAEFASSQSAGEWGGVKASKARGSGPRGASGSRSDSCDAVLETEAASRVFVWLEALPSGSCARGGETHRGGRSPPASQIRFGASNRSHLLEPGSPACHMFTTPPPLPPCPSPAPEQWPGCPGIWRRGARAGRGPS